jgi:protein-tyrosine-phosphatase
MPSVLFVCTYNQFRSPLAAAFFQQILNEKKEAAHWTIGSAGTWATINLPIAPLANQAALKYEIDLKEHRTTVLDKSLLQKYELVLVMESGQKEAIQIEFPAFQDKVLLLSEIIDQIAYDIPDPALFDEISALSLADEIHDLIRRGYKKILEFKNIKVKKNKKKNK